MQLLAMLSTLLLVRHTALLAPTLNLLVQLLVRILNILHHLIDLLASRRALMFAETRPDVAHQIHHSEELVWQPSYDGAPTGRL